ncbi:hypothetical protein [Helicobacter sp. 12S02232-10]|uniref:hypothetical protein n=1 Tax=Helicobacter sp. 12S02232-10 TaxID=1476197 RepID=UPI0015DDE2D4|nr:hypothetical protein [Helicobacter sp. 12S02232-10]
MNKDTNLENNMPYKIDLEDLANFDEEIRKKEREELLEMDFLMEEELGNIPKEEKD